MRNLLEKAIVHLLNGDQSKAETLFHKFMVERAREIHESLRQNEDVQLNEGWDDETQEEEYFDNLGDKDDGVEGEGEEAPVGDADGEDLDDMDADADDLDADAADLDADAADLDADAADLEGEGGDTETKLNDIEAKMEELSAQFDRLMSELDVDSGGEDLGNEDLDSAEDLGGDLEGLDGDEGAEEGFGNEETESTDLADRMEDDLGDDDQPEHEMAENAGSDMEDDDEMMEDITESVLAELDRVAMPSNADGKEIGSGGKTVSGNHGDMLPHHPVKDRVNQAKPYMVKGGNNDSFDRETPPSSKDVKRRRNNDAGVKKLTKVPAKGDASAKLNSDFASRPATQSTVDGKKSSK